MRILSRYFATRFIGAFAAILCAAILLVAVIEMLLNIDDMLELGSGADSVVRYLVYRIPSYYFPDLLPLSSFAAAFVALGLAARNHELLAMRAGGIAPWNAALPVLGAAALLSCVAFLLNESVGLEMTRRFQQLKSENADPIEFRRGAFWYHRGRTITNIAEADQDRRTLRGVQLFELSDSGHVVRSIESDRVQVAEDGSWIVENATIRHFPPDGPDGVPSPHTVETGFSGRLDLRDATTDALLEADASTFPLPRLIEYVASRPRTNSHIRRLEVLTHTRVTEPLGILLFAGLAIPVALSVERVRQLGRPALVGAVILAVFFSSRNAGLTLGREGVVPAAAAAWTGIAAFAGVAGLLWIRVPR